MRFVLLIAFLFGILINFFISEVFVYPHVLGFEREKAVIDLQRIAASIQNEIASLAGLCSIWAADDESNSLIFSSDALHLNQKMAKESLAENNINLIYYVNIRGEVVWGKIPHIKSSVMNYVSVSIGVTSLVPRSDNSVDDIFRFADKSLYVAKAQGRNRSIFFDNA